MSSKGLFQKISTFRKSMEYRWAERAAPRLAESFLRGETVTKHSIERLVRAGQLKPFIKPILESTWSSVRPENLKLLLTVLWEARELSWEAYDLSYAAELCCSRFKEALGEEPYRIITLACEGGYALRAIDFCQLLVKANKSLSVSCGEALAKGGEYWGARKMFLEYLGALSLGYGYLPQRELPRMQKALPGREWDEFLEEAFQKCPDKLGLALIWWAQPGGPNADPSYTWWAGKSERWHEAVADMLLRCYSNSIAAGDFSSWLERRWLDLLVEFWRWRRSNGNLADIGDAERRWLEYRKRVSVIDFEQSYLAVLDAKTPGQAVEFNHLAAQFFTREGKKKKAAEFYEKCGRYAKAERLRGGCRYDLNEARVVFQVFGDLTVREDLKEQILERLRAFANEKRDLRWLADRLMEAKTVTWAELCLALRIYRSRIAKEVYQEKLRSCEGSLRRCGAWFFAAKLYLFEGLYDEFDRICQEENELEIAALWYKKADMPGRAARIFELMDGAGGKWTPWGRQAGAGYEEEAARCLKRGEEVEATEMWSKAGEIWLRERALDEAVICLEKGAKLPARVVDLLAAFDKEKVLSVLARENRAALALAQLHLRNGGEGKWGEGAFETCYELAVDMIGKGGDQVLISAFLKGAMLAASWGRDEMRQSKAVDLALKINPKQGEKQGSLGDRVLFLLAKIILSGAFQLIPELSKLAFPSESPGEFKDPFQVRLLAPIYLYRGIKLADLLRTMAVNKALAPYAALYNSLLAGIEAGKAEKALEDFMFALEKQCDWPDPKTPLNSWEDVERRLPNILLYAQPECLVAMILWDELWAIRWGIQELRETLKQAEGQLAEERWADVEGIIQRTTGSSLFGYLSRTVQAEIYELACRAAFLAEKLDEFDRLAAILEEVYGTESAVRTIMAGGR